MKKFTVIAAMTLCVSMGLAKGREDFVSISGKVGEVAFVSQELTFSLSGKIRVVDNSVVTATRTVTGYLVTVSPASKLVATVPEVFHWTGSSVPALVAGLEGRYSARNKNIKNLSELKSMLEQAKKNNDEIRVSLPLPDKKMLTHLLSDNCIDVKDGGISNETELRSKLGRQAKD